MLHVEVCRFKWLVDQLSLKCRFCREGGIGQPFWGVPAYLAFLDFSCPWNYDSGMQLSKRLLYKKM